MKTKSLLFALCCLCIAGAGCSSVHTTHIKRNPEACGWDTKHLRGVPVTVSIPYQLEVQIVEVTYYDMSDNKNPKPVTCTKEINHFVREKKEVITVDFVKPAAGVGNVEATLDNQFFKSITGHIEDKTIETITASLKTLTQKAGTSTAGSLPGTGSFERVEHLLASKLFDVNDRELERKVHEFAGLYLNGCGKECPRPTMIHTMPTPISSTGQAPRPMNVRLNLGNLGNPTVNPQ